MVMGKDDREHREELGEHSPPQCTGPALTVVPIGGLDQCSEASLLAGDHLPLSHNAYHCNGSSFSSVVCLVSSRALSPSNTSAR